jgi:hypothetical protein
VTANRDADNHRTPDGLLAAQTARLIMTAAVWSTWTLTEMQQRASGDRALGGVGLVCGEGSDGGGENVTASNRNGINTVMTVTHR